MKSRQIYIFLMLLLVSFGTRAQITTSDTTDFVRIVNAKDMRLVERNGMQLTILSGNVILKQGTSIFKCDSCVLNPESNLFEAFGRVHINESDTTNVYSNYLRYLTDKRMAYLKGNVKMTDGHGVLTTNDLEYDVVNRIGTYRNGGRVVNKKSVLTSQEGMYYADLHDIYFRKNVVLKDPSYTLRSDSLLYNTETQLARFIAQTKIIDSSGRVINTSGGFYDLANSKAEFTSRTDIQDGSLFASADEIINDDKTKIIQLRGRAVTRDTVQGHTILAGEIFVNTATKAYLAVKKPVMIIEQDNDSVYVAADTLFSARLSDLYPNDSLLQANVEDSANRYFEGYRHVRVFSDSLQSVSDSLFYSFKDSTFRLFQDPVVWSNKNQISGDTIYLQTKNKKADRVRVIENSFLVSEVVPGAYNQIKSARMDGYFKEGAIDSVRARGFAESVYFLQDEDSSFSSVNQTTSDVIDIYFLSGELNKVVLRSAVKGTLSPLSQKPLSETRLKDFRWQVNRRPKTKFELLE